MIYAPYDYYKSDFGGVSVPGSVFPAVAARASRYLDAVTMGKASDNACEPAVMNACCAVADVLYKYDTLEAGALQNAGKSGETVGRYSVSYADTSSVGNMAASKAVEMLDAARLYLFPAGLLYRGVRG